MLFQGRRVTGRVQRVVLRGKIAYVDGHVLAEPGFGQNVRTWKQSKVGTQQRYAPVAFKQDDQFQLQVNDCSSWYSATFTFTYKLFVFCHS